MKATCRERKDDSGRKGKAITEEVDVDNVAEIRNGADIDLLLCECKFTRRKTGIMELEELVRKGLENTRYMLFSRSGFTDELIDYAEDVGRWAEGVYPQPLDG